MSKSHGRLHPPAFEIYKRKKNSPNRIKVGDHDVKLANVGPTIIHDAALAHDIDQLHGRNAGERDDSLLVVPVDNDHLHRPGEAGHRYTFTVPELPWHRAQKKGRAKEGR